MLRDFFFCWDNLSTLIDLCDQEVCIDQLRCDFVENLSDHNKYKINKLKHMCTVISFCAFTRGFSICMMCIMIG